MTHEQATSPMCLGTSSAISNEKVNLTGQLDTNDTVILDQSTGIDLETIFTYEDKIAEIKKGESENSLVRLYQKVLKAKNCVIQTYQEEIRC
ncbi:11607_t:CDS:2 [Diversispora eburnea]|uniref:11607_t:CDS:1 n=1 Tax=Diversispora eburnea TaxID=1213867 RepID=A0A9N9G6E0_9GLOM|nr:11607_t:CDS:2 [Diversispora eburnea]